MQYLYKHSGSQSEKYRKYQGVGKKVEQPEQSYRASGSVNYTIALENSLAVQLQCPAILLLPVFNINVYIYALADMYKNVHSSTIPSSPN